jgi:hypothetical protein
MTEPKSVSINPNEFVDDDGILDMSLEEAFKLYHRRNQDKKKEDKEKPARIHCRQVIKSVIPIVRLLARENDVSVAEFSLCISLKVLAEMQSAGVVSKLSKSYNAILEDGIRNVLFDELSTTTSGYNIICRDGHAQGWFFVYPQVYSALDSIADCCGTEVPVIYQVGLAMALSKSEQASKGGKFYRAVDEILRPEQRSFLRAMALWKNKLDGGLFGGSK